MNQKDIIDRLKMDVQHGQRPALTRSDVRKLLLKLKFKSPKTFSKVKALSSKDQRKLFLQAILEPLGLGGLGKMLGPLGTSALGVGVVGAAAGLGALAGRASQSNEITELKQKKLEIDSQLMMLINQRDNERGKLDYKLGELENQLSELHDMSDSGVNNLNLWVDSHTLL